MWDYRDMTGTMLWYNDERGGEYFNLQGITSGGVLRLDTQVKHDYPAQSTSVIPVIWGILQQENQYSNFTSDLTQLNVNVELINHGLI